MVIRYKSFAFFLDFAVPFSCDSVPSLPEFLMLSGLFDL